MTKEKLRNLKSKITESSTIYTKDIWGVIIRNKKLPEIPYEVFNDVINSYYEELFDKAVFKFELKELPEKLGILRVVVNEPRVEYDEKGSILRANYPATMHYMKVPFYDRVKTRYNFTVDKIYKPVVFKGKFRNYTLYRFFFNRKTYAKIYKLYE